MKWAAAAATAACLALALAYSGAFEGSSANKSRAVLRELPHGV